MKKCAFSLIIPIVSFFLFACQNTKNKNGTALEKQKELNGTTDTNTDHRLEYPSAINELEVNYIVDPDRCTCRSYYHQFPPPAPEHPVLKDEVKTGNKYDKYLMHVSLIEREDEVLLKEDEHQIFDLYMWDTTKKWNFSKKVTFVHPMSHWCFYTLELRHDSRKGRIYVGYENEGKFYCFYEIWTDDSSFEENMKEGPERAEGVVYGNIYFKYKKQIIPTQLLQQ